MYSALKRQFKRTVYGPSKYQYVIKKNASNTRKRKIHKNTGNAFNSSVDIKEKMMVVPAYFTRHYFTVYPAKPSSFTFNNLKKKVMNLHNSSQYDLYGKIKSKNNTTKKKTAY